MPDDLAKINKTIEPFELHDIGEGKFLMHIPRYVAKQFFGNALDPILDAPEGKPIMGSLTITGGLSLPGHAELQFQWKIVAKIDGELYMVVEK